MSYPYMVSGRTYARSNATNYSTNGYPTRIPTLTQPSGDGVIAIAESGSPAAPFLTLVPYGQGSATNTFSMRVLGWRQTQIPAIATRPLWIPCVLIDYAVTIGTGAGVVGGELVATDLFATTITSTIGPTFITSGAPVTVEGWFQISPTTNLIAMVRQPTLAFPLLELIFTTGGVATSCNCLWARG